MRGPSRQTHLGINIYTLETQANQSRRAAPHAMKCSTSGTGRSELPGNRKAVVAATVPTKQHAQHQSTRQKKNGLHMHATLLDLVRLRGRSTIWKCSSRHSSVFSRDQPPHGQTPQQNLPPIQWSRKFFKNLIQMMRRI